MSDKIVAAIGHRPDVTMECSGAASSVETGILSTRSGGVIVLVGLGPPRFEIPVLEALSREIDIRCSFRFCNAYTEALAMVSAGIVDVKPLITHRFKLEQTLEAFETVRTAADGAIKVILHCSKE